MGVGAEDDYTDYDYVYDEDEKETFRNIKIRTI